MPIRRLAIIITNAKLDSWHMYASTGCNEFLDDNDNKCLYFVNAEKYRYASWRLKYTYGRDVVGYCQLRLTSRCRHPAPGQDLIPLQSLHVFAHSRDPHPAIKLWCQVPFTKSKTIFQIEMYCIQYFFKTNIWKVELSMIKIGELLRKLWFLRSCFLILPPGALTPQGIEGATKRDVSKHWCAYQWCASRGWFIAHENWTSCEAQ